MPRLRGAQSPQNGIIRRAYDAVNGREAHLLPANELTGSHPVSVFQVMVNGLASQLRHLCTLRYDPKLGGLRYRAHMIPFPLHLDNAIV